MGTRSPRPVRRGSHFPNRPDFTPAAGGCGSNPTPFNNVTSVTVVGKPTVSGLELCSDADDMLKDLDKDKDGAISREEGEKAFAGFFDNQDANKDGKVSREEWDAIAKFISEGKDAAFALKAGGTGDVTETHMLWKKTKGLPNIPSALVYRGQYVMVKDGGVVTAYDMKTGDEVYQKRVAGAGAYYASPVAAGGHIYFTNLTDGEVTVLKAGSADVEVVAKNPPLGERVAATPAIADNTLYIRTAGHLYAFAERK
jgi:hypothetical protein